MGISPKRTLLTILIIVIAGHLYYRTQHADAQTERRDPNYRRLPFGRVSEALLDLPEGDSVSESTYEAVIHREKSPRTVTIAVDPQASTSNFDVAVDIEEKVERIDLSRTELSALVDSRKEEVDIDASNPSSPVEQKASTITEANENHSTYCSIETMPTSMLIPTLESVEQKDYERTLVAQWTLESPQIGNAGYHCAVVVGGSTCQHHSTFRRANLLRDDKSVLINSPILHCDDLPNASTNSNTTKFGNVTLWTVQLDVYDGGRYQLTLHESRDRELVKDHNHQEFRFQDPLGFSYSSAYLVIDQHPVWFNVSADASRNLPAPFIADTSTLPICSDENDLNYHGRYIRASLVKETAEAKTARETWWFPSTELLWVSDKCAIRFWGVGEFEKLVSKSKIWLGENLAGPLRILLSGDSLTRQMYCDIWNWIHGINPAWIKAHPWVDTGTPGWTTGYLNTSWDGYVCGFYKNSHTQQLRVADQHLISPDKKIEIRFDQRYREIPAPLGGDFRELVESFKPHFVLINTGMWETLYHHKDDDFTYYIKEVLHTLMTEAQWRPKMVMWRDNFAHHADPEKNIRVREFDRLARETLTDALTITRNPPKTAMTSAPFYLSVLRPDRACDGFHYYPRKRGELSWAPCQMTETFPRCLMKADQIPFSTSHHVTNIILDYVAAAA